MMTAVRTVAVAFELRHREADLRRLAAARPERAAFGEPEQRRRGAGDLGQVAPRIGARGQRFEQAAAVVKAFMPMYKSPWYRYFITFNPAPVLKNVKVPVLALNGEHDLQVAWKENLDLIAASLKTGGNEDVTIKAFPRLNHLFQTSPTGLLSEYSEIEETISPEVLKTVSDWILRRTAQKRP